MPISPTGLPTPVVGDDPDVPSDMLALATALDKMTVPKFGTTAARDAAYAAGATFTLCYVLDVVYRWRANAWQPLVDGSDLHPAAILGSATMSAVTLPAGGGTLGISSGLSVAAVAWPRLVQVTLVGTLASATTWCSFTLRIGGAAVQSIRAATPQQTIRSIYTEVVAANTSRSYDAVLTSTAGAACYAAGTAPDRLAELSAVAFTVTP